MKRKKILIQNDYIEGGGVELILYYLATHLAEKGHQVTIKTIYDGREAFAKKYPKGIKYFAPFFDWEDPKFLTPGWWKQKISWELHCRQQRLLDTYPYDVAIAIKEDQSMREIAQCAAKRKFAWVHSDHRYDHWTSYAYATSEEERSWMEKFEKVVCVSKASLDSVIDVIGDPGNLCVRYNPMDYRDVLRKGEAPCDISRPEGKPLFVTVGRLAQQKNYMLLLEVCRQLQDDFDFEVWIVGDGPQRQMLEEKIAAEGIRCVKLLGEKKNPHPYIKQADWFISTAEWESYGLAMQEALILGVPVLTAYCKVVDEVLDPRFARVMPNSPEGIRDGMKAVLCDPNLQKEYQQQVRQFYDKQELWEKRLEDICALWED